MASEYRVIHPKIVKLATSNMFFEVFDCLVDHDRESGAVTFGPKYRQLRFTMLNHKQKVNGKSAWVSFSMHERDFLLLRHLIMSRTLGKASEGKGITWFRGGSHAEYSTGQQSRVFTMERQAPSRAPFSPDATNEWKILVTIQNGPGLKGKTGQVMPAKGGDSVKLMFPMDEGVAISMVEEIYLYLQGFHAFCHKWIQDAHVKWADFRNNDDQDDAVQANAEEMIDVEPDQALRDSDRNHSLT